MDTQVSIVDFMRSHPFFSYINEAEKARMLPYAEIIILLPHQEIFKAGTQANSTYFIARGTVQLSNGRHKLLREENEVFGTEAAFANNSYEYSAHSQTETILIKFPSKEMERLLKTFPEIGTNLFFHSKNPTPPTPKFSEDNIQNYPASPLKIILAWFFAFIAPVTVYHLLDHTLDNSVRIFLATISSGLVLWGFNVVYEFVPVLIVLITSLVLGLVPSRTILEGFSSDSYLLILSLSGMASAIISSGLIYRFITFMVKLLPAKQSWYTAGLFLLGSLMTPIIPSAIRRSRLMVPITQNLIEVLKVKNQSSLATKISVAGFYGVTSLNSVFFTGSIINFIAIGILPLQVQHKLSTIGWTTSALMVAVVLIVTNLFGLSLWFHERTRLSISRKTVSQQLEILGPLSQKEWNAIIAVFFFIGTTITFSLYQIQFAWLSLFLFFALASLRIIKIQEWAAQTDWSFLLMVSAGLGIYKALIFLNIDGLIKNNISPGIAIFGTTKPSILASLVVMTILTRLLFSIGPSCIIMLTLGLPIAEYYDINLWVTTLTILIACEIWFFPYQSTFYRNFEDFFEGDIPYERHKFLIYNLLVVTARILAIYLSIPYWRQIGLL